MARKKIKIQRESASSLRPKKLKPFDVKKFVKLAKELRKAVEEEERKYGPVTPNS